MLGGRGTASVQGASSNCTMSLKIRPMERALKEITDDVGAENVLTMIGTRFDESATRGANMRQRGESASKPIKKPDGSLLMSPIADWSDGDVWGFLNATPARLGFDSLDYSGVIALYEAIGESTCSIGAVDPSFSKKPSSCGGSRTGCWACQKVSRDHSLEGMVERFPAYEPLTRLSRTIRAGHYVLQNRSLLAKTISPEGGIKVFANGYSAQWTESLLKWTLSIDATEDDRAFNTGKPRRFPRLLDPEHILLIGFSWARYGLHSTGAFIRIYDAVATGARYPLPTDPEIATLEQASDRAMVKTEFGELRITQPKPLQFGYQDGWRSVLSELASFDAELDTCAVPAMSQPDYKSGAGVTHDSMVNAEALSAEVNHLLDADGNPTTDFHDFMWWYALEHAAGKKSHASEINWLLREGIIRARRGYQSQIVRYQQFGQTLADMGLNSGLATLETITSHPAFVANRPNAKFQLAL
ncbi:phosphoadenosine phosphosulfate reductase family protein [Marinobacter sp. ELB17]|uniref:phosphoadenosine phosphosulfate reductase domain-containing protein n=1 Tax=Marinobacter sp. ELB17 TaxID=270374 RepID=UPI001D0CEEF3|nr:phosphoadenosine phosphosulfate reductase family protein [Marinobacter sp. ELB17]